jgi:hypothetical protein
MSEARTPSEHGSAPTPDPVTPTAERPAEVPVMPHEPAVVAPLRRAFTVDDEEWVAHPSGLGAYGTGHWGLAPIEAIHFARAQAPDKPVLEALLTYGRLEWLYPSELIALYREARPIVVFDQSAPPIAPRRFSLEEEL